MTDSTCKTPHIIIAGAGISGICLAIQLKRAGLASFQIFEKSSDVGGVWLQNDYPGAGCDVPSHLYSFSFARRFDWSEKYPRQPEILRYLKDCVARFGVRESVEFGTAVEEALYDEREGIWRITTSDGRTHTADIFVSAVGQLNRPHIPDFPGLTSYQGPRWHTACWNHDFDLSDRRVAVVGNGASAIQVLPKLADTARTVTLFQRTASWVQPLSNYRYKTWQQFAFRWVPLAARLHRFYIFARCDSRFLAFGDGDNFPNKYYRHRLTTQMRNQAPRKLRKEVVPKYLPGCKRILQSDDYLQSLGRENVRLVAEAIETFTPEGIDTSAESHAFDAIVFATGFHSTGFLQPMHIVGRGGESLHDAWNPRPRTLLGMTAPGFPNLFLLYGPNTNLGHNSVIFMVECQVRYLLKCLKQMRRRRATAIEPTAAAVEAYDARLQQKLDRTVWAGDCNSWYKQGDGSIVNNWSSSATSYWWHTRRVDFSQFHFIPPPPTMAGATAHDTASARSTQ